MKELPALVYSVPNLEELMLDEGDNVREGFLEHGQHVRMASKYSGNAGAGNRL
ncbi:MAG: hypothetical protein JO217_12595 [Acidobacteriaceae bacterium]|nr:hypothetical protein [Acidobacteriaceae bacterium]